jgi:hypothetical protein
VRNGAGKGIQFLIGCPQFGGTIHYALFQNGIQAPDFPLSFPQGGVCCLGFLSGGNGIFHLVEY